MNASSAPLVSRTLTCLIHPIYPWNTRELTECEQCRALVLTLVYPRVGLAIYGISSQIQWLDGIVVTHTKVRSFPQVKWFVIRLCTFTFGQRHSLLLDSDVVNHGPFLAGIIGITAPSTLEPLPI